MQSVKVSVNIEGKNVQASLAPIIWEDWVTYGLHNGREIRVNGIVRIIDSNLYAHTTNSILMFDKVNELECFLNDTYDYPEVVLTRENIPVKSKKIHENCVAVYVSPEIEILNGAQVDIFISTGDYSYIKSDGIQCFYWSGIDRDELLSRFKHEISLVSDLLGVTVPADITFCCTRNITELSLLTGQNSTFAYRNKLLGLVYCNGRNRSDIHELTHYLLFEIGTPTYLFVEGMAILVCDLLLRRKWDGYFLSEKISARFHHQEKQTWIRLMFSHTFSYRSAQREMDLTAAAFLAYIYRRYGLSALMRCYTNIDRRNSDEKNDNALVTIFGKRLEKITNEWLSAF